MDHDRAIRQRIAGSRGRLRTDCMSPTGSNFRMPIVFSPRVPHRRSTIGVRPSIRPGVRDALVVGFANLVYFAVRGTVDDRQDVALAKARWLIDLEQSLGIY